MCSIHFATCTGKGDLRGQIKPMLEWTEFPNGTFSQRCQWETDMTVGDLNKVMNMHDFRFVFEKNDFSKSAYAQ